MKKNIYLFIIVGLFQSIISFAGSEQLRCCVCSPGPNVYHTNGATACGANCVETTDGSKFNDSASCLALTPSSPVTCVNQAGICNSNITGIGCY